MRLGPLEHQRRAKALRKKAQSLPEKEKLLKWAGFHQAMARRRRKTRTCCQGKPQLVIPGAERIRKALFNDHSPGLSRNVNTAPDFREHPGDVGTVFRAPPELASPRLGGTNRERGTHAPPKATGERQLGFNLGAPSHASPSRRRPATQKLV